MRVSCVRSLKVAPTRAQTHTNAASLYTCSSCCTYTCSLSQHSVHQPNNYLSFSLPSSTIGCLLLPSSRISVFRAANESVPPRGRSFVSDLNEGRSIGRFSSSFSSATTTPRRVEKLLSGLPIRAWKKIQVDRTHSREKDDGKEEWEPRVVGRGRMRAEEGRGRKGEAVKRERREREREREREGESNAERKRENEIKRKRVSP